MRGIRARASLVLSAVVFAAACRDPTAPNQVTVVNVPSVRSILVTNRTSTSIFTMIIGVNALPATDYVLCLDPRRCEPLAPGASRELKYPGAYNGVAEKEALVMWWHSIRGSDGTYRPVDSGRKVVPL